MAFSFFGRRPTTSTSKPPASPPSSSPPRSGFGQAVAIGGSVLGLNAINSLTGGKFYDAVGLGFMNDIGDNLKLICGCISCLLSLALTAFIAFQIM